MFGALLDGAEVRMDLLKLHRLTWRAVSVSGTETLCQAWACFAEETAFPQLKIKQRNFK
jgi:hypothetical protein